MSPVVLDANVVAGWLLPDEDALELGADVAFAAPQLLVYELANILIVAVRRGRIDPDGAREAETLASTLPITYHPPPPMSDLLALATTHGLSAYDAAYLALAKTEAAPLATFDKALAAAARAEGLEVRGAD